MSRILCVYPEDPSTKFLNHLVERLNIHFRQDFHCFKVKPNSKSHNDCLGRIRHGDEELVIFLGHGTHKELYGADSGSLFEGSTFSFDNSGDNIFINQENIDVFYRKKVFCLSCNSNGKLSKWAVEHGATTFLGFGDIPTDWVKDDHMKINVSKRDIYIFRKIITKIVSRSLMIASSNNFSFGQLEKLIKILTNNWMHNDYYSMGKFIKSKEWINKQLFLFKDEMKISGNKEAQVP